MTVRLYERPWIDIERHGWFRYDVYEVTGYYTSDPDPLGHPWLERGHEIRHLVAVTRTHLGALRRGRRRLAAIQRANELVAEYAATESG